MGAERYLCLPDLSTGFKWSGTEKRWNHENLTTDTKYLVEQFEDGDEEAFTVKEVGSERPVLTYCKKDQEGEIVCGGLDYGFMMNTKTLRYQHLDGRGFVQGYDDLDNTLALTIGRCSSLN